MDSTENNIAHGVEPVRPLGQILIKFWPDAVEFHGAEVHAGARSLRLDPTNPTAMQDAVRHVADVFRAVYPGTALS